jgi:CBS domain-containing protein
MTERVETCAQSTDLASVAMIMLRRDCGIVPVVDESCRVVGVVTDRDICMAAATRHLQLHEMTAGEVMSGNVLSVRPEEDVRSILEKMSQQKVRRVPVVDADRRLIGIVSLNDIVLEARLQDGRPEGAPSAKQVVATLQGICRHPATEVRSELKELELAHA